MRAAGHLALVLLTSLLLAAVWIPGPADGRHFALLVALVPAVSLMAVRRGGGGRAGGWLLLGALVAAVLVAGGVGVLVRLDPEDATASWLLGLPTGLGVMVWVVAVAPLFLLGLLFGLGFRDWRPSEDRLERLRRLARGEERDG